MRRGKGKGTCRRGETYMHILREAAERRQVGTRVAEVTASRRRHFLSLLCSITLPRLTRHPEPWLSCLQRIPLFSLSGAVGGPGVAFQPVKATPPVPVASPLGLHRAYGVAEPRRLLRLRGLTRRVGAPAHYRSSGNRRT